MSAAMDVLKRNASRSSVTFFIRRFVRRSSSVGSASPPEESSPVTSERARLSQREVAHDLGEEAGVEQVQDSVLDSAGVLVDREPLLSPLGIERSLIVVRRK